MLYRTEMLHKVINSKVKISKDKKIQIINCSIWSNSFLYVRKWLPRGERLLKIENYITMLETKFE